MLIGVETACFNGHSAVVAELLDAGAMLDVQSALQQTPLHWACGRGQLAAAKVLLSRGAKVNVADSNGDTPLHR